MPATSFLLDRATALFERLQGTFAVPDGSGLYREAWPPPSAPQYAYLWPFSRALVGTLALAGVADVRQALGHQIRALEHYWSGRAYDSYVAWAGGGDRYLDDNVWVALALVQAHRMGLSPSLDRPLRILRFGLAAWSRDGHAPCPGGVYWVEQGQGAGRDNHDRGAGATAAYAALALHLVELGALQTTEPAPEAMLGWLDACLDSGHAGRGPYWNAVRRDGSIDTNLWTYNQGVALAAHVQAYRVTHAAAHLQQAEAIAQTTLATFGDFTGQPPSFNSMCFQHLLVLHAATADAALRNSIELALSGYAEWVWQQRDPATNLFYFDDAGRPVAPGSQPARVQDVGAVLQLFALQAWPSAAYVNLA